MSDIQSHHFTKGVWMLLALLFYFLSSPADIPDNIKTKIQQGEQLTDVPTIYITIPSVSDISKMSKWVDGIKDKGGVASQESERCKIGQSRAFTG